MTESATHREAASDSHNYTPDALEAGVAAVFAAIQATGFDEPEYEGDPEDATLALLAELNRIWAQPLSAS
jgi:hypothetical protein